MMVFMRDKRMVCAVIVPVSIFIVGPGVMMIIGIGGRSEGKSREDCGTER